MTYADQLVMVSQIRPGNRVLLTGWQQPLEVVSNDDGALLTALSPDGREFNAGRMSVERVYARSRKRGASKLVFSVEVY